MRQIANYDYRSLIIVDQAESPLYDLQQELKMLALPFRDGEVPSEAEIRVAASREHLETLVSDANQLATEIAGLTAEIEVDNAAIYRLAISLDITRQQK